MFRKIGSGKETKIENNQFPKKLGLFYWNIIKKFPFFIGLMFFGQVIRHAVDLSITPLASMWMFEVFEKATAMSVCGVLYALGAIAIVYLIPNLVTVFTSWLYGAYGQLLSRYKMYVLYGRLYNNDTDFFVNRVSGQIGRYTGEILNNFSFLTYEFWSQMVGVVLGFLFIVGALFTMNVWLVLIVLGNGIFRTVWQWQVQKRINKVSKEVLDVESVMGGVRTDGLDNVMTAKYFGATESENKYLWKMREPLIGLIRKEMFLNRWRWLPTSLVWLFLRLVIVWICFNLIRGGQMTVAQAAFVWGAATSISNAFVRLNDLIQRYSNLRSKAKHAWDEIIVEPKITDKVGAKNLKIKDAKIEFDDVSFGYNDSDVVHNFDLKIASGERVGLVGLSGAGKTTLANLLLRMYDVKSGVIKIDGMDIREVKQLSLRKNIALVPQETALFNRTILENIRYGNSHASRADVIMAAKKANIHDFISGLPKGYDTLVGNRGIKLSGGQRQRIAIARAILKNAPILILDEATSALDSANEMLIQSALAKVMRGKTTVAIAHRLSTLRNMDRIIVMNKGKIVETGTHTQLLRAKGEYYKLWKMQTSGFVGE